MWHKRVADTVRRMIGRLLPVTFTAALAMRAALKKDGYVTAGVTVTATAKDGVVDTAGVSWQYH
jgi:hypothetical protein